MEEIFNYKRNEDDDYYKILGCDPQSSIQQICTEYKIRALQYHPDKNCEDCKSAEKQFTRLQQAKDVLTDVEMRKKYDQWRNSCVSIPFEKWINLGKNVHNSMHWVGKMKTEPMVTYHNNNSNNNNNKSTINYESNINAKWEREDDNNILRKFRNYEI